MTKTIKYSLDMLKGLYSDTPCELGDEEEFLKYQAALKIHNENPTKAFQRTWQTIVRRGWNGIVKPSDHVYAKEIVMSQLNEMDRIFITHFSRVGSYFMTGHETWTSSWSGYTDAMERHAEAVAQRPELDKRFVPIRDQLPGKVRFALADHGGIHLAPPFPIVTCSVIPVLVRSVDEIQNALNEVSFLFTISYTLCHFRSRMCDKVECTRLCGCFYT
jgi:hypothetical protein